MFVMDEDELVRLAWEYEAATSEEILAAAIRQVQNLAHPHPSGGTPDCHDYPHPVCHPRR